MKAPSIQVRYMLGMVVDATGSGMYLPLSLLYFHHVTGLPVTQVGAIMSAAAVLGLVSNPLTGLLIDRFGARAVVVGGYLLRAVGFATYPLVDGAPAMFAAVALVAFGDVSFPPSIQSFVAEIVKGPARDKMLAVQRSTRNAGLGAGGLLAGAVLTWGSDAAYHAIVLSAGAAYVCAAVIIRSIPAPGTRGAGAAPVRRGYRLVARNRPFLTLTLLNVPVAFGYMVLAVSLPVYLTQELGAPESLVGVLYAVNTVGIALLQIPVTRVVIGYRRTRATALGISLFALSFVAFAVLGAATPAQSVLLTGVFAATAVFTLGELLHGATASALVASAAPEETRGRHLAVYQLSWAIPTALAPAVLTWLLTLSVTGMWLVLTAGVAASAITMLRLEPRLPAQAVRPTPPSLQEAAPPDSPSPSRPSGPVSIGQETS
ncbi:MFS transporter [Planotetraspora thailandica]|uniref:MFS transporter n=1 Tax=Planotetraspora thailandica TaxID=487172 RepID=A0A8J3V2L3_9ACTN|nr:MFS transporter [Planotetraspora thailandica]GII54387.1 MFS transporter [Planotetraspora thailandica]